MNVFSYLMLKYYLNILDGFCLQICIFFKIILYFLKLRCILVFPVIDLESIPCLLYSQQHLPNPPNTNPTKNYQPEYYRNILAISRY